MKFYTLRIQDFLSHQDTTLDLSQTGLWHIGGSNGSGKSTLGAALVWVLYGRTPDGFKGNQVIREGQKTCKVTLELSSQRQTILVERSRDLKKGNLFLHADGEDIRGPSDKETQKRLEQFLGMDYQTFLNVVYFPQEAKGLAAMTDSAQKEVLDQILGLYRFQDAQERAKTVVREVEKDVEFLDRQVRDAEVAVETLSQTLLKTRVKHDEFEDTRRARLGVLEGAIKETKNEKPYLTDFTEQIQDLEKQISREQERGKDARQTYDRLKDVLHAQRENLYKKRMDKKDAERQLEALKEPAEPSKDACPTCGQDWPEEVHTQRLREYEKAWKEWAEQRARLDNMVRSLADGEVALQNKIQETESAMGEISFEDKAEELRQKLQDARYAQLHQKDRLQEWEGKLDRLQKEYESLQHQTNPFGSTLDETEDAVEKRQEEAEETREQLKPLLEDLENAKFWVKGFGNGGVKSLLLSTVTPFLNERATFYLRGLTGGKGSVEISTQKQLATGEYRDKLEIRVNYGHGPQDFKTKSGGERKRVALALLFALGDLAATRAEVDVPLRILDEPWESIDGIGCEAVVDLLKRNDCSTWVITHSEELSAHFEQRIQVFNENGISRVQTV